jgi:hypothetical protein
MLKNYFCISPVFVVVVPSVFSVCVVLYVFVGVLNNGMLVPVVFLFMM